MNKRRPISAYAFTILLAILIFMASYNGLNHLKFYAGNSIFLQNKLIGQDLITLFVGMPLLLVTGIMAFRGSGRGYLLWLGILGYCLYTYACFACGIAYNQFYLIYVAIFSISLFTFVRGLTAIDAETFCLRFSPETPVKVVAFFLILGGIFLAYLVLNELIPALIDGKYPRLLNLGGTNTLVNQVFELGIISPLAIITGVWVWKRKPWGFVLASILLFRGLTIGLTLLANNWIIYANKKQILLDETMVYGLTAFISLILLMVFLKNFREETINSYHNRISAI